MSSLRSPALQRSNTSGTNDTGNTETLGTGNSRPTTNSNQLDRSPDSPCLHSGPNSAAPKIINPAHKPANQQRRSPAPRLDPLPRPPPTPASRIHTTSAHLHRLGNHLGATRQFIPTQHWRCSGNKRKTVSGVSLTPILTVPIVSIRFVRYRLRGRHSRVVAPGAGGRRSASYRRTAAAPAPARPANVSPIVARTRRASLIGKFVPARGVPWSAGLPYCISRGVTRNP